MLLLRNWIERVRSFFVHNNIKTIFKTAENIQKLVPDAKIGVAHGRLSETELEKVMEQFIHQQINVLVCTTIIDRGWISPVPTP